MSGEDEESPEARLARRLSRALEMLRISPDELARQAGVDRKTVYRLLAGKVASSRLGAAEKLDSAVREAGMPDWPGIERVRRGEGESLVELLDELDAVDREYLRAQAIWLRARDRRMPSA